MFPKFRTQRTFFQAKSTQLGNKSFCCFLVLFFTTRVQAAVFRYDRSSIHQRSCFKKKSCCFLLFSLHPRTSYRVSLWSIHRLLQIIALVSFLFFLFYKLTLPRQPIVLPHARERAAVFRYDLSITCFKKLLLFPFFFKPTLPHQPIALPYTWERATVFRYDLSIKGLASKNCCCFLFFFFFFS